MASDAEGRKWRRLDIGLGALGCVGVTVLLAGVVMQDWPRKPARRGRGRG